MATWEQSGNPGGLLGSIGQNNSNAPRVGDINSTLEYIRNNNDRERTGENNLGLTALRGLGAVKLGLDQNDAAQQTKDFQSAYGSAYASGDRNAMRQLAAKYPGQMEAVQKGMGFIDDDQRDTVGNLAASARLAASNPETFTKWLQNNASDLDRVGVDPQQVAQMYQQDPKGFGDFADHLGLSAVGPDKYFDIQDKIVGRQIDQGRLNETVRSNKAGESLTSRGQDITMRGQDISASTARRGQDMSNQRAETRLGNQPGSRQVQLADGRTVNVGGKLHGSGANAFYEGIDNAGNMVRVPATAIAAPATSAATAQNYAMKKDLDAVLGAPTDKLGFMTGMTGGNGSPSWDAEARSRWSGGDQRQLFNATKRIQGKMQNQGIAAARDMGASGINTVAEAKMYFQGMPQVDYSSPESMQQSMRDIQQYTENYNQQYSVDVGKSPRGGQVTAPQPAPQQQSGFSSLWGD